MMTTTNDSREQFNRHGANEIVAALMMSGVTREVIRDPADPDPISVAAAVAYERRTWENSPDGMEEWYYVHHLGSNGAVKGAGTEMIRRVVAKAAKAGTGVYLNAIPEAYGFYESLGFEHLDGSDAGVMGAGPALVKTIRRTIGRPTMPAVRVK